ncbi:MAG: hypothetical protein GX556_11185 [Fibrobacter sp.]|nr:hypothetical protein [Fibrobacter sp.]
MDFHKTEKHLEAVFGRVGSLHSPEGHRYIKTHWYRYAEILSTLDVHCWNTARYLFSLRIYPLLHLLFPPMRKHIVVLATKGSQNISKEPVCPPLSFTGELGARVKTE